MQPVEQSFSSSSSDKHFKLLLWLECVTIFLMDNSSKSVFILWSLILKIPLHLVRKIKCNFVCHPNKAQIFTIPAAQTLS